MTYTPAKETAKVIRKVLKANFPGVKFSVVTRHYTSIRVRWTDGPKTSKVKDLVGHMKAGNFNSMIDLYEYTPGNDLLNKYVFTERKYSRELIEGEILISDYDGSAYINTIGVGKVAGSHDPYWTHRNMMSRVLEGRA